MKITDKMRMDFLVKNDPDIYFRGQNYPFYDDNTGLRRHIDAAIHKKMKKSLKAKKLRFGRLI
jgi:hypothetical protein